MTRSSSLIIRLFALAGLFLLRPAEASFMMDVTGDARITVDRAPVRVQYPDGRIIDVVERGRVLSVTSARGDGRGTWLDVSYKKGDRDYHGCVDSRFTSFGDPFHADGKTQPKR
jgi:hypothetical protein